MRLKALKPCNQRLGREILRLFEDKVSSLWVQLHLVSLFHVSQQGVRSTLFIIATRLTPLQDLQLFNSTAVPAIPRITPGDQTSVTQKGCKRRIRWVHFAHVSELMLYRATVAPEAFITPSDHGSIRQDRSKSSCGRMKLPDILQVILNFAAISTRVRITPGHSIPRTKYGSKCSVGGFDLLHIPQLMLNQAAVATRCLIAPSNYSPIGANGWESMACRLNQLDTLKSPLNCTAFSTAHGITLDCLWWFGGQETKEKKQDMPQFWWINHQLNKSKSPHVTAAPSLKIAAKAPSVDCTCWTFWRRSRTALLSPPHFALPQVTTLPSPGLQNLQLGPRNRPTTSQNGRLQDQIVWNQFETLSSDCRKSTIRRLHLQHVPEFILNCTAITTTVCTPGHDLAICSDCSKGPGWCSLYCLHTWYLLQVVIKIQNIPNRFPKWRVNQQKIDSATPGHCVTDPGLQCCHHQSPDGPRWRLHRFPRWRQKNRPMPGWSEHLQDSQFHPGWALSLKKWRSTKSTGIVLPNSLRMENKNIFSLKKPKQKKTCQDITQWSKPQPSITITTIFRMAPGDNRSICQDGRESTMGRLHLLHTSQPQLDPAAVATRQPTAPRHDTVPSTTEECEGGARGSKRWILGNRTETAAISSCSIAGVRSSTTYQVYQEPDVPVVVLIPKSWGVYRPPK